MGLNSYPNVMALLAGEPDVDKAEEECKQKVRFFSPKKLIEHPSNPVLFIIIPCSILYSLWYQGRCTDDYIFLDERGLLLKVNIARIANAVTIDCQVTKIVMNSGSQLSELSSVSQMSLVLGLTQI